VTAAGRPPVVLLAGGFGSRLAEETEVVPKPMVEIGGRPIIWHIMKGYRHFGCREFYLALGYRGEVVKRFFLNHQQLSDSLTVDLGRGTVVSDSGPPEDWIVHMVDTGLGTNTGGRLRRLRRHLAGGRFLLTYGDGVSDVDVDRLLAFHCAQGRIATVTAIRPPARFGVLMQDERGVRFAEKRAVEGRINGGFMVLEADIFRYLDGDDCLLEEALERVAGDQQLAAYPHPGFWQCMDTLRDRRYLESLWSDGSAPWRLW
jgi:glucose-1-phosphate cytidylyltransferase